MKIKASIDFSNEIPPSKGCMLLSEPFLDDPNFGRSTILMCEHSAEESFGFILNNPSSVQLNDLIDVAPKSIPVYIGGPVAQNSLFYLHTFQGIDSSEEIIPGLYFGGDLSEIFSLIEVDITLSNKARFFVGYSGWSLGQLEQEVSERAWICVNNIPLETLLSEPTSDLWRKCMALQGKQFQTFAIFPKNPLDN
jgi:putative transcriptional regulator